MSSPLPTPIKRALVLICEKCGRKCSSEFDDNPSRRLQKKLKASARERFGKKEVRAVLTTCLDVCLKNKITVSVVNVHTESSAQGAIEFFEVEPTHIQTAVDKILERIF